MKEKFRKLIEIFKSTENYFYSKAPMDYWNGLFLSGDDYNIKNDKCCSYLNNLRMMALYDDNLDPDFYVLFEIVYNVLCKYGDWPSSDFDYKAILKFYKNNKKNILNHFFYKGEEIKHYYFQIEEKAIQSVIDYFCKPTESEIEDDSTNAKNKSREIWEQIGVLKDMTEEEKDLAVEWYDKAKDYFEEEPFVIEDMENNFANLVYPLIYRLVKRKYDFLDFDFEEVMKKIGYYYQLMWNNFYVNNYVKKIDKEAEICAMVTSYFIEKMFERKEKKKDDVSK